MIAMRNGIYSSYVTLDGTALKGIALVENDAVAGFNRSHIYFLERLAKYPPKGSESIDKSIGVLRQLNTRMYKAPYGDFQQ